MGIVDSGVGLRRAYPIAPGKIANTEPGKMDNSLIGFSPSPSMWILNLLR